MSKSNIFIFSSVGSKLPFSYKEKTFNSWEIKDFDSGCVIYNQDNFLYQTYFQKILYNKNYKFPNFFYFNTIYNIIDKYNYVLICDDDLIFNQKNTINTTISLMSQYDIDLCSISNDCKGKSSYDIMRSDKPINEIWISNFCEMGCMFISCNKLKNCLENILSYSLEDYGFDVLISSLFNNNLYKIGIIKNLTFYNPYQKSRYVGYKSWKNAKIEFSIENLIVKDKIRI